MFYLKTWACAIIPLFNLQKDITQKELIEHKGLWIRMKVQRSVTVPQPGSIWMPHGLDSMKNDGLLSINVMVNCLFYDLTNSKQKEVNLWHRKDSSHSSFSPVEKFQRSINGHFSVMKWRIHTQWENLHLPHDQSCDKGQILPAWHSPTKKIAISGGRFVYRQLFNFQTYIQSVNETRQFDEHGTLQSLSTLCAVRALCTIPCLFINSRPSRISWAICSTFSGLKQTQIWHCFNPFWRSTIGQIRVKLCG